MAGLLQSIRAQWAILIPAFLYLYIFPYMPLLRSPNEICRSYQTRAIVDHHTIEINDVIRELGPIGDLSCVAIAHHPDGSIDRKPCPAVERDRRFAEKHYYPSKAPLISVLAVPVYALLKAFRQNVPEVPLIFFSRLFCTILPAILVLFPVRRFLRAYVSVPVADGLTVTYALGSLAYSYAELYMSHQTTAVLLFSCFYVLWRTGRREWSSAGYALAGFLAGLSVVSEYTAPLGLVPLAVYAIATAPGGLKGRSEAILLGILGTLPPAIALGWYHQAAFGSPFASGYKFLNDAAYQGWHTGGFLGVGLPDGKALILSFFSPLRGLFVLSPFLLLAFGGFAPRFWREDRRAELALSVGTFLLYAYFTSSFSYDSWGWTTGPRHLTPLVPFLLLPAALFIDEDRTARFAWWPATNSRGIRSGVAGALACVSIIMTSFLTFLNYIPDPIANAWTQLALAFPLHGYLPQTLGSLAGVANPWAALPAVVGALATSLLVMATLWAPERRVVGAVASIGTLAIAGGLLSIARPVTRHDVELNAEMVQLLERAFVPKPGQASPPLWKR
jgi:hypothetical protein